MQNKYSEYYLPVNNSRKLQIMNVLKGMKKNVKIVALLSKKIVQHVTMDIIYHLIQLIEKNVYLVIV